MVILYIPEIDNQESLGMSFDQIFFDGQYFKHRSDCNLYDIHIIYRENLAKHIYILV